MFKPDEADSGGMRKKKKRPGMGGIVELPARPRHSLYEQSPDGRLRLHFHAGQLRAWDSKARVVAVLAGSQGGKTSFGPFWLWREIQIKGGGDYIAATSNYDLFKLKMLPEMRQVFEGLLKVARYWTGDRLLELRDPDTGRFWATKSTDRMWGRILLRSGQSSSGLESSTAKAAWLDEAGQDEFPLESFEAVERRLTLNQGRILITTTPYNLGWLKQEIVDKADGKDIEVINFPSILNPNFPRAEFERLRKKMPDWKFKMFHEGLFQRPPGMIYKDFINEDRERGGHKCAPFDIPAHWERIVGVDPGANNTAVLYLARDPRTNIYYAYDESLEGDKSSAGHARKTYNRVAHQTTGAIKIFVGQKAEKQQRLDWRAAGVVAKAPPISDVEGMIDKVIELLLEHRLYIFDTLKGTLAQIMTYSRVIDRHGEVTDEIKNKAMYHYLDALRYAVVGATYRNRKAKISSAPLGIEDYRG